MPTDQKNMEKGYKIQKKDNTGQIFQLLEFYFDVECIEKYVYSIKYKF